MTGRNSITSIDNIKTEGADSKDMSPSIRFPYFGQNIRAFEPKRKAILPACPLGGVGIYFGQISK